MAVVGLGTYSLRGSTCIEIIYTILALLVAYSGSHASYLYCAPILKKNHIPILTYEPSDQKAVRRFLGV